MTTHGRGHFRAGNGRFTRSADTAARDAAACRLRSRGETLQAIADELGFADKANARRAIQRALTEVVREDAEHHVQLALEQLDQLAAESLAVLEADHFVVSAGRLVHGPDGQPLRDDLPVLLAVDRLLRIQERRARLLGLDAPARHRVPTGPSDVDAAVVELAAELARRPATPMTPHPHLLPDPERNPT